MFKFNLFIIFLILLCGVVHASVIVFRQTQQNVKRQEETGEFTPWKFDIKPLLIFGMYLLASILYGAVCFGIFSLIYG